MHIYIYYLSIHIIRINVKVRLFLFTSARVTVFIVCVAVCVSVCIVCVCVHVCLCVQISCRHTKGTFKSFKNINFNLILIILTLILLPLFNYIFFSFPSWLHIILIEIAVALNEAAPSYHGVRGLYFLSVIFAVLYICSFSRLPWRHPTKFTAHWRTREKVRIFREKSSEKERKKF